MSRQHLNLTTQLNCWLSIQDSLLDDLSLQLRKIWSYRDLDLGKCRRLTKFYEESRAYLLRKIYDKNYYNSDSYPQRYFGATPYQFYPARHPVTQLEWVLVYRYGNLSEHKSELYCSDSYGEIFGQKLCFDHPVENTSYQFIQSYFIDTLERIGVSVQLMSDLAYWIVCLEHYSDSGNIKIIVDDEFSGNQTLPVKSQNPLRGSQIFDFFGHVREFYQSQQKPGIWGSDYSSEILIQSEKDISRNFRDSGVGFRLMKFE